jgi:hypothetical protein
MTARAISSGAASLVLALEFRLLALERDSPAFERSFLPLSLGQGRHRHT